jgi:2-oxoglutarate ferredoxin oxidoreductase subunit alpha
LEHDEAGHPASRPANHVMMVAKRRRKLQVLASRLPKAETYGPAEGNVLLVGWGSSHGPIREAVDKARAAGESVSSLNIRYIQPLQPGIGEIFEGFNHVFVVEINDEGLYGYGQLAAVLRARYCTDKIRGINKTDGLPFKVREILNGMNEKLKQSPEPTLVSA